MKPMKKNTNHNPDRKTRWVKFWLGLYALGATAVVGGAVSEKYTSPALQYVGAEKKLSEQSEKIKSKNPLGEKLVEIAREQLGKPYKFGSADAEQGFDCSGFTYYVYRQAGFYIMRTARAQYATLTPVARPTPGDLVYFAIEGESISHTGVYTGKGRFIHSPREGKTVEYASIKSEYWKTRYRGARRYKGQPARLTLLSPKSER